MKMNFQDNKAKYLQIAGYVTEHILLGRWPATQRIPSIRDMAIELNVNPNTVMRAYECLKVRRIIINNRGLGLFVAVEAIEKIKASCKDYFIHQELPAFFRNICLLEIEWSDLKKHYLQFKIAGCQNTIDQNNKKIIDFQPQGFEQRSASC